MTADDPPEIPIVCSECDTRTRVPFDEFEAAIESHNESVHAGESIAEVDPVVREHLADRLAEELGLLE
ncbi:MAG: hypothetical protein PPP58_04260 [Natronomonas sp.]